MIGSWGHYVYPWINTLLSIAECAARPWDPFEATGCAFGEDVFCTCMVPWLCLLDIMKGATLLSSIFLPCFCILEASQSWTETSETKRKNKSSLIQILWKVLVSNDEKLIQKRYKIGHPKLKVYGQVKHKWIVILLIYILLGFLFLLSPWSC